MRIQRTKQGMTLVEIIFAFAIVSTVLTLAYAAALGAWRNARTANQRTQAQYMIQQTVEAIKAYRESDDFDWPKFIEEANIAGSPMKIGLEQEVGTTTYNDFTCNQEGATPEEPNECKFVLEGGFVDLSPVGSNTTVPSTDSYRIEIIPTAYFVEGDAAANPINLGGVVPDQDNITAISFVARATWNDANGVVSNAIASTILTEPR